MNWALLEHVRDRWPNRKDYWGKIYRVAGSGRRVPFEAPLEAHGHCPFETSERKYIPKTSYEVRLGDVGVTSDTIWRVYFQCCELGFFPLFRSSFKTIHGYKTVTYFVVCPGENDAILLQTVLNK